ncbi:hypothetical protein ACFFLZ_10225 [Photobacterium aphoticum]|uniref:Uncharacterized protein n=1 Tax=Photobacterium aphoticum TaxID=754436 RepID=A0A0J1GFW5_9GAMM|nr:hypothetical protein [Photobacterium aphoticum]KLU98398.1 hypothetical protein ABT58_22815 [Photobacterium aphoticum]PSU55384.1 hypothetical protein C9I90_16525 [Photobacterium aphoticum]GHA67453.1 hypothetical protein GCM10007086_45980 [Photobacterium aphoticum]
MVTAVTETSKLPVEVDVLSQVDTFIDDLIVKHGKNSEMVNLMALEATSLATSVSSRSKELESQGFLARLWGDLTGKNQKVTVRNTYELAQSQYLGQQMLNKLAENNLMTYQMVVSLGDKVNRVVADVNETQQELAELNQNLATFFASMRQTLEAKFTSLERNDDLLFWKETLGFERVYQGKTYGELTRPEKMVCLANEFYHHSHQQWSPRDLSFFKAVMVQVGHHPDEKVSLKEVYQSYQEQPVLLEQLFKGIDAKPELDDAETLMPALMGLGKLQTLETIDAHIIDTILEYSPNASKQDLSLTLATKYVQQTSGRDLEREVPFFDVVMNLVEDLVFYKQLQASQKQQECDEVQEALDVIELSKVQGERNISTECSDFNLFLQSNVAQLKVIKIGHRKDKVGTSIFYGKEYIKAGEILHLLPKSSPCVLINMYGSRVYPKGKKCNEVGNLCGGKLMFDADEVVIPRHLKDILPKYFSDLTLIPGKPNGLSGPYCLIILDLFSTLTNGVVSNSNGYQIEVLDFDYSDWRNQDLFH